MKGITIKKLLFVAIALVATSCADSNKPRDIKPSDSIYIIGASFAYPENGWFESACAALDKKPLNRAISGTSIGDNAVATSTGLQFKEGEHDSFDLLVIMHTHNLDVCDATQLAADYKEYAISPQMDKTQAFDYVIRRYIDECRTLEFDPKSKWYKHEGGKPVRIILCTHWHDARTLYNDSVRRLCQRWSSVCTLCEFDKLIGFTKDIPDADGTQESLKYAHPDNGRSEVIDGVTYGWHPLRGVDSEIQRRMAQIFVDTVQSIE